MAKTQEESKELKKVKRLKSKDGMESKDAKGLKEPKGKDGKVLMKRVKKAIKRSRHKLSEEKFEKELQRTIGFLEELQQRINKPSAIEPAMAANPNPPDGKKNRGKSGNGKARGKSKPMTAAHVMAGAQSDPSITGK